MADSEDQPGAGTPPSDPKAEARSEARPPETYDETPYSSGDWSSSGSMEMRSTTEVVTAEPVTSVGVDGSPPATPPSAPPPSVPPAANPPARPPKPPGPPDEDDEEEGM